MHSRPVTQDIVVLSDLHHRAVLVRGRRYATAIDPPHDRASLDEFMRIGRSLSGGGVRNTILTREPADPSVSLPAAGLRVIRGDRTPGHGLRWDILPACQRAAAAESVHVVHEPTTVYDDNGRPYYVEPCAEAGRCLAVLIEPEDVLVVSDDIQPGVPPRLREGDVHSAVARYHAWRERAPRVVIPASGIPIEGAVLDETLHAYIRYATDLRNRVQEDRLANHPWERMVYTIPWCSLWRSESPAPEIVERHHHNLRATARELSRLPD